MHDQIHLAHPALADALARSQLSDIIQPYLRYIEGWQLRASYLRAQFSVHPAGSNEHDLAEKRLELLRSEIMASREFLVAETALLPPDDRLEVTLEELDQLLAATRPGGSSLV